MFYGEMPAGLQDVVEANQVGFDVRIWMSDGIADARLGSQITEVFDMMLEENPSSDRLL